MLRIFESLRFGLIIVATAAMPLAALAVQPDEIMPDAGQEHRARAISGGLRCLVCQNQSIDDSDAPLARDLRLLVRERIKAGDDDSSVINYVVARYGDFVLLKPPFTMATLLLWLSPLLFLLGGLWVGMRSLQGRRTETTGTETLSEAERAKLKAILGRNQADQTGDA